MKKSLVSLAFGAFALGIVEFAMKEVSFMRKSSNFPCFNSATAFIIQLSDFSFIFR